MDPQTDQHDRPGRDQRMDAYDARVLTVLREVVEERRTPVAGAAEERARRRWARRPLLVAAAAAAVVAGGLVVVPTLQAEPAWAVSRDAVGDVDVQVNRMDDAAGLERALGAAGISADVTFLPDGTWCAPGRFASADVEASGLTVSTGERSFGARVPAGAVPRGTTLVITASVRSLTEAELRAGDEDPGDDVRAVSGMTARVEFGVASGPVAACTPVAVPPLGTDSAPSSG